MPIETQSQLLGQLLADVQIKFFAEITKQIAVAMKAALREEFALHEAHLLCAGRLPVQERMNRNTPSTMSAGEKLLYTQSEAAQALGLSLRSIERMVSTAQVRTQKLGRRRNIPASEVRRIAREGVIEIVL